MQFYFKLLLFLPFKYDILVPDTPEQRWDTISITEGTYFEN